ncbi:MAG: sugar-binding domain-containing protein, partial [Balneolaceae bacterium]
MTFNPMVFGRIIAGTCITRICIVMLFLGAVACQKNVFREVQIPDHQLWPRPEIVPVPVEVSGVHDPVVSLNGTWKFNNNPPENFWRNDVEFDSWYDIRVPAQASFHIAGLTLRRNAPIPSYVYKKVVEIPGEFDGKRVKLRFQGVTGDATVWVNGTEAGTHHGGFTIWNPDITDLVTPGQEAVITVSVHEPASGQSTNTYSGGIIRGVDLIAVPENHITRFHIDSDLDNRYRDAMMNVWVAMAFGNENESAEIRLTMRDPGGEEIALSPSRLELSQGEAERIVPIPVSNPMKWSAEHPHLYTIRADLLVNGSAVQTLERRIGFRKIEIDGQKLLVNGNEVKLRGSAQFDSHPLNGISLTREEVIRDLTLYKEANHNHIRPSCYIANEEFLAAADSIGIYVAGEMPVTFA